MLERKKEQKVYNLNKIKFALRGSANKFYCTWGAIVKQAYISLTVGLLEGFLVED